MSTSTLGGFESEERKILYDEYLFQRRVLFGITISIIFAAFIWTIAICTDHWILVAGEKRKYINKFGHRISNSVEFTGIMKIRTKYIQISNMKRSNKCLS